MKIIDVRFVALRYPLAAPIRLAWGPMTHRHFGLVFIDTDEGITGVGETSVNFPHWAITERRATVEEGIRHLLVGEDPLRIEHLWQKMYHSLIRLGLLWGKGAIMSAIGGADIALWDIAGKALEVPVYQLLGGCVQDRIPLYATGFSVEDPAQGAMACVEAGYRAVKVRVGFDPTRDLASVETVRRAVGDEVDLLVDANMAWELREALRIAQALEPFDLYWLEEPLRADDVAGLAELARRTAIPLAAGENAFGREDVRPLLEAGALGYIMPDPTRAGGLTECKKICDLAWTWGVPYSPHHYGSDVGFAAALHLLASTPEEGPSDPEGPLGSKGYMLRDVSPTPLREDVLAEPLVIADGYAQVPSGPGLGIVLNEETIAHYRIDGG